MSAWSEQVFLHIRSYEIHRLKFNVHTKIPEKDARQWIIGKVCKSQQSQLDNNKSFSIFVAIEYIDSITTYILKYHNKMSGNQ